ncbi:MAG: hypothetical protein LC754_16525 [Acidobacteria bacterium]|nr:hypothetical protein [Acidobacteriota bacterium]
MAIAESVGGEAGLKAVQKEVEAAAQTENLDLVRFALRVFITHNHAASKISILPFEQRAPEKVVAARQQPDLEMAAALSTDPESALNWFREDPDANEHHAHWHVVYPGWDRKKDVKDRQGELFFYMHQQMIARYDTERMALGMATVKPLSDYRKKIPEGYDPGRPTEYASRKPGLKMVDINRPDDETVVTVGELEKSRDRVLAAVKHGYLKTPKGKKLPINPHSLGGIEEPNAHSANGDFYGYHHGTGHNLICFIHDPDGKLKQPAGIMADFHQSICDPVFYRWHKHVDDVSFNWQQKQPPHNLSDAPKVLMRRGLKDSTTKHQSPDIILCFKDEIPGSEQPEFDGQAFGEKTFGGQNWDKDPASAGKTTAELQTMMRRRSLLRYNSSTGKGEEVRDSNGNPLSIEYLNHREFCYFLRVKNLINETNKVTVRIFLVAKKAAKDRRMWVEMDKFQHILKPLQSAVIFRSAELASVIRKPVVKYSKDGIRSTSGKGPEAGDDYCKCGWPYTMLLPRGTREGMEFRMMVMVTDWNKDNVGHDTKCSSMSFCGAKDIYPDKRGMGYPFDRPFPKNQSIEQTFAKQDNIATRDISIKWIEG